MRLSLTAAAAVLALTSLAAQDQQPTFRSGARTVAVYATVAENNGRLVPDLTREDFEVKDSGKVQQIKVFSAEIQPITVIMMLDRSGSMRGNFRIVEAAGEAFVRRMIAGDKARIGSFAEKVIIDPDDFTADQASLINILRTKLQEDGPTPLWNAIEAGIEGLKGQEGRRVVLVFSDGADAPGNFKLNNKSFLDVQVRAQREDVMVYAIGLAGRGGVPSMGGSGGMGGFGGGMGNNRPDPGLAAVAGDTGGGYFELTSADDLASSFARVADELHRQYLIGFEPQNLDGKMHKLEVKVKKPGLKVRARKEYLATK